MKLKNIKESLYIYGVIVVFLFCKSLISYNEETYIFFCYNALFLIFLLLSYEKVKIYIIAVNFQKIYYFENLYFIYIKNKRNLKYNLLIQKKNYLMYNLYVFIIKINKYVKIIKIIIKILKNYLNNSVLKVFIENNLNLQKI